MSRNSFTLHLKHLEKPFMNASLGRVRCQPLRAAPGCRLHSSITGRAGRCSQRRHSSRCRRLCDGEVRSSLDPDSSSESKTWPRHAKPDASKSADRLGASWEESDVSSSIDEAQLAKNRETFLLRLASLGFGVSPCMHVQPANTDTSARRLHRLSAPLVHC